tara:strand:- start:441 stop:608 length:168 start_codon:yes stop_codon:yes gene_type:complete
MKELKHIDKIYSVLFDCRRALTEEINKDMVSINKKLTLCTRIDRIIGEENEQGNT